MYEHEKLALNGTPITPVVDPGFLKGGFSFSLTKMPAQFELKTKKKRTSTFKLLFRQYLNPTALLESLDLTALLEYMNFKRGFPWKP